MKPKQEAVKPEQPKLETDGRSEGEPYEPPEIVVHDSDEFVRSLGPAQACSPSVTPFY